MSEEGQDDRLIQYVQLQAVSKSNEILFTALACVLEKMDPEYRVWFCQSLRDEIQELLEIDGEDVSAHAGLLGVMMRQLIEAVLPEPYEPS